jgi:hypothetical protein
MAITIELQTTRTALDSDWKSTPTREIELKSVAPLKVAGKGDVATRRLHFWQLLGWGYVANCAAVDWQRVIAFEKTGGVPPSPTRRLDSMFEKGKHPFSPRESRAAIRRVDFCRTSCGARQRERWLTPAG